MPKGTAPGMPAPEDRSIVRDLWQREQRTMSNEAFLGAGERLGEVEAVPLSVDFLGGIGLVGRASEACVCSWRNEGLMLAKFLSYVIWECLASG